MLNAAGIDRFTTILKFSVLLHLQDTDVSLDDVSVSIKIEDH